MQHVYNSGIHLEQDTVRGCGWVSSPVRLSWVWHDVWGRQGGEWGNTLIMSSTWCQRTYPHKGRDLADHKWCHLVSHLLMIILPYVHTPETSHFNSPHCAFMALRYEMFFRQHHFPRYAWNSERSWRPYLTASPVMVQSTGLMRWSNTHGHYLNYYYH